MKTKLLVTWGIILVLLVSVFGTAGAQTGPVTTPTPPPTDELQGAYVHPIAQIIGAYFGRDKAATDEATPTPETPVFTPEEIAEQVNAYHEEGIGFGVLVKLYAMAEASAEKCSTATVDTTDPAAQPCVVVSVDELVTAFQGGQGMGQLFKEYGKPALLGVGHVKKELKKLEQVPSPGEDSDDDGSSVEDETTIGNGKDKDKDKDKDKGNGNGNGNGNGKGNKDKQDKGPKQKKP